ncbi:WD40/YVTN/BNR-like repeat-containing protein [Moheibacter lacus]|uniref:Oxidoreductase n=1 Tax=Moheibacter lacus TaxID=2745851 RepID=A0A838ZT30_9FLAO|nr:oxidoreductase [Moheibacter lacus]MBA5630140.1 oxidoreductase [Moheibacter lacus]
MKKKLLTIFTLSLLSFSYAQQIKILNLDKPTVSFRGLSVVDNYVLWVSGTNGTIGVSYNAGKTFNWINLDQYKELDFRSIYALDAMNVIAVAIGSPGIIIKSTDGGANWKEVYKDESPEVFLDAIDFSVYNQNLGVVVGDPINGEPYVLKTVDGGDTWKKVDPKNLPVFAKGEAFFAASNSNVKLLDENTFIAVTGGEHSSIMYNSVPPVKVALPKSESKMAGANGLDYYSLENFGLIVGGDFEKPNSSENNLFVFELKEMKTPIISTPVSSPKGYKSGVSILNGTHALVCGLTGVDITKDRGQNWTNISGTGYHSCKKAKNGNKVYLTGPNGRIGYYQE